MSHFNNSCPVDELTGLIISYRLTTYNLINNININPTKNWHTPDEGKAALAQIEHDKDNNYQSER